MRQPLFSRVAVILLVATVALTGAGFATGVSAGNISVSDGSIEVASTADIPETADGSSTGVSTVADAQPSNAFSQNSDGGLRIVLQNTTSNYTIGEPVNVSFNGNNNQTVPGSTDENDTKATYELSPQQLPAVDFSSVTIKVTQNGDTLDTTDINLNKIVLADTSVDGDQIRLATKTIVGPPEVTLNAVGPDTVETVTATRDGDTLVISQSDIEQFYLPPTKLTLAGNDDYVEGESTFDINKLSLDGVATDGGVEIYGNKLVPDESYLITVETTAGNYEALVTATSVEQRPTLALTNPVLSSVSEANITVRHDAGANGDTIVKQTVQIHSVRSADVAEGSVILNEPLENEIDSVRLIGNESISDVNVSTTVVIRQSDIAKAGIDTNFSSDNLIISLNEARNENNLTDDTLAGIQKYEAISFQNYTLSEGSEYHLLITPANGTTVPVTVAGDSPGAITVPAPDGGDGDGTTGSGSFSLPGTSGSFSVPGINQVLIVVLFALVGVLATVLVVSRTAEPGPDGSYVVQTTVVDHTGQNVIETVSVDSKRQRYQALPATLEMGDGPVELDERRWELYAELEGSELSREQRNMKTVDPSNTNQVELTIPPYEANTRIVDVDDNPIPDVDVTISAVQDAWSETVTTGKRGRSSYQIPAAASPVTLQAEHEHYESINNTYSTLTDLPGPVTMPEKTGGVKVTAEVDGDPTAGIQIEVGETRQETNSNGTVEFENIPHGEHEVVASLDKPNFGTQKATVDIVEDTTTEIGVDLPFELTLSGSQRNQLQRLKTAERLTPPRRIDGAINGYYESVFESLAGTVETLVSSGSWFAESDLDAEPLIGALLEAGEEALQATDTGLSTKHNVDLFSACSQMSTAQPEWTDDYTVEGLFSLAEQGRSQPDTQLGRRIHEMDSTLQSQRSELTVISPARDPFNEIRDIYDSLPQSMEFVEELAYGFVLVRYLDAMEAMIEDDSVRTRLNTSIY